jgi:restriction system protein
MPIPDFQSIMLPLLKFAADGKDHPIYEAIDAMRALWIHRIQTKESSECPSVRVRDNDVTLETVLPKMVQRSLYRGSRYE